MKIELGGGLEPTGDGFVNIDKIATSDLVLDLEEARLPFADDSVDAVYTAHCLEHVRNVHALMGELLRVCRIGAEVEIRTPHWNHPAAMCCGHVHTISDWQIDMWVRHPERHGWTVPKRFKLVQPIHYARTGLFDELRGAFSQLNDEQMARFVPGCCWEIHAHLEVVPR